MSQRNLSSVLGDMLGAIPEREHRLRERLESRLSSVGCTAPEIMPLRWHEVQAILIAEIGEPREQWQQDVARIFVGPVPS